MVNTILIEDFEDATGWTLYDINTDTWGTVTGADGVGTAPNTIVGTCAYSEKSRTYLGGTGNATPNNYMISPQITIPTGAIAVNLSYIIAGYGATAGNYTVYFATNITSDVTINAGTVLQASSTIAANTSVLRSHSLMALAGQTGYIVFRHSNNNAASGLLLLDSVLLTSTVDTNIQTTNNVATSGNNNLKGAGTAPFNDSATKNIMTVLTVGDTSDYGCTSVAVTRDQATVGAFAAQYGTSVAPIDFAMAKRFTITPTTVVSNGAATITFYFTAAEVAGWEAFTGNNRSLLYVVKDNGAKEIRPLTVGAFGTGVTLTATFATGVDGVYTFARQESLPAESFELTDINLYPNPNNGNFSVQFAPSSNNIGVTVFDMRGRVIYDRKYQNNGLFDETIHLESVQSGIYLVKIQDGSRSLTKKIIVE
ncbi:MAG: T9SS type A sorting domain-containing protein [Bacteroidia bacterium]